MVTTYVAWLSFISLYVSSSSHPWSMNWYPSAKYDFFLSMFISSLNASNFVLAYVYEPSSSFVSETTVSGLSFFIALSAFGLNSCFISSFVRLGGPSFAGFTSSFNRIVFPPPPPTLYGSANSVVLAVTLISSRSSSVFSSKQRTQNFGSSIVFLCNGIIILSCDWWCSMSFHMSGLPKGFLLGIRIWWLRMYPSAFARNKQIS